MWESDDDYALLPGQPYAGDEAGTQIDHPFVDSRYVCVWVEHWNSIGEEKVNISFSKFLQLLRE